MKRAIIAAAIVVVWSASATAQETVLGRWCDQLVPNIPTMRAEITIKVLEGGEAVADLRFFDGSDLRRRLIEQSGGIFRVADSTFGDRYRVVPGNGELQLIDNDGLIRTARRLENVPQPGDCLD